MHYANSQSAHTTKHTLSYFICSGTPYLSRVISCVAFERRSFSSMIPYSPLVFLTRQSRLAYNCAIVIIYHRIFNASSIAIEWLDITRDVTLKGRYLYEKVHPALSLFLSVLFLFSGGVSGVTTVTAARQLEKTCCQYKVRRL